jgi:ankyrin repeat protein
MGFVAGGAIEHAVRAGDVNALSAAFHGMLLAEAEPSSQQQGGTGAAAAAANLAALQPMVIKGAAEAGQVEIIQWLSDWAALQEEDAAAADAAAAAAADGSGNSSSSSSRAAQVAQQCTDMLLGRQDTGGATALHWAAAGGTDGHVATVKWLLEAGGAVDARDQHGCQPLHWAARGGHPEVMRLLLAHGADSSAADSSGVTALHLYCGEGHLAIVQALVTQEQQPTAPAGGGGGGGGGSSLERLSAKDGRGYTPLDWAVGCGRHKVAAWLHEQQEQ